MCVCVWGGRGVVGVGVGGPIMFWSDNGTVIDYVEVILNTIRIMERLTREKGYIVYLTTHLLPVSYDLSLHLFWC